MGGVSAVDLAVLEGKSDMLDVLLRFEEDEDKSRNERVKKDLEMLADDVSEDSDSDPAEGRLSSQTSLKRECGSANILKMRSSHLLRGILKKNGLNVDDVTAPPVSDQKRASFSSARKGQERLVLPVKPAGSPRRSSYRM